MPLHHRSPASACTVDSSHPRPRAFKLVELLVVVTIIVVLLTLLMPAMGRATYEAGLVRCGSTQRAATTGVSREGFEVVGISLDEDKDALIRFAKDRGLPWPQYFEGDGWANTFAKRYCVRSIPRRD
jgi:type II secretory pathway pseudopilin PulG